MILAGVVHARHRLWLDMRFAASALSKASLAPIVQKSGAHMALAVPFLAGLFIVCPIWQRMRYTLNTQPGGAGKHVLIQNVLFLHALGAQLVNRARLFRLQACPLAIIRPLSRTTPTPAFAHPRDSFLSCNFTFPCMQACPPPSSQVPSTFTPPPATSIAETTFTVWPEDEVLMLACRRARPPPASHPAAPPLRLPPAFHPPLLVRVTTSCSLRHRWASMRLCAQQHAAHLWCSVDIIGNQRQAAHVWRTTSALT